MAAPTNISAATATDIGTLPATISQNVHDGVLNYTVWYKYTPLVDEVISIFGYSADYVVAQGRYHDGSSDVWANGAQNLPVQLVVRAGTTYYFQFIKNVDTSPAVLSLSVIKSGAILDKLVAGLLVPDDVARLAAIVSTTYSYTIIGFIEFPTGAGGGISEQQGDSVGDTFMCAFFDNPKVRLYDRDLAIIPFTGVTFNFNNKAPIRANKTNNKYYSASSSTPADVYSITKAGFVTQIATIGGSLGNNSFIAVNDAETILYYHTKAVNESIKRWDLVNNIAMTDFIAAIPNYRSQDILTLPDTSVLIAHVRPGGLGVITDYYVNHYSAAGAVLNTYNFGGPVTTQITPRIGYALDYSNSFWAWRGVGGGINRFENIKISDGSSLKIINNVEFPAGVSAESPALATPTARFGNPQSCPFFLLTYDSGLYKMVPARSTDKTYINGTLAIPNPYAELYLVGDE